jgi:hypothetical protein
MDRQQHPNPKEAMLMMATRLSEISFAQDAEKHANRLGLRAELGPFVMRKLRRTAILLLDMRTEFDFLAPGALHEHRPRGPMSDLRLGIARRVRRVASQILDPWTQSESLD